MTLSTWQLIVVGSLAAIWAVVLGVPLLADLLRWFRNRPPASLSDSRPWPQRARSSMRQAWSARPRPVSRWRAQDAAQRRLQILLGCGMASVLAMFLAIAFRGLFVPLFAAILGLSVLIVAIGAVIGARHNRNVRMELASQARDRLTGSRQPGKPGRAGSVPHSSVTASTFDPESDGVPTANPWQSPDGEFTIPTMAEIAEAFETPDRDGFMFEPLDLDQALASDSDRTSIRIPDVDIEVPLDPDLAAELGLDVNAVDSAEDARFTAAPEVGPRQASARARRKKRNKARPIYIESVLDDVDEQGKAINDY